jgi:putative tricarboxylic transport membrane protein
MKLSFRGAPKARTRNPEAQFDPLLDSGLGASRRPGMTVERFSEACKQFTEFKPIVMIERVLNIFWVLLGAAAASYAWTLGILGPSGPESGLFPFISALIVLAAGIVLLLRSSSGAVAPNFPRGAALGRVLGVVAGLAFMAASIPYLGFAVAGFITMIILLRTVEKSGWLFSVALAFVSVVVVVWLFGRILGMPLPRGPWGW